MKKYGNGYTGVIAMTAATALWLAPLGAQQTGQGGQTGQAQTQQQRPQQPQQPTMTAMTVKAGDIARDPEKHYNKKVTVTSEVDEVLGLQTFTLDEDAAFAGPDVLVISPALTEPIAADAVLTVTGMLKPFVEADLKRDYDWNWWADWKTEMTVQFKDRPVLLAESIKTKDGKELVKK
jgi:hypothetical protein